MTDSVPLHVVTRIESPIREIRLAAVDDLAWFAAGDDPGAAADARMHLQRLTEDDSRAVSAAAATALERTAIRLNPDRIDFGQVPPGTAPLTVQVLVEGPPLAATEAAVHVSGAGLRAAFAGRQLHIEWTPGSEWLDGSVAVRGPAGWAEVRVTGEVTEAVPLTRAVLAERVRDLDGVGDYATSRVTVLPAEPPRPRHRRRAGAAVLVAGLTSLVLIGGVGVAVALTNGGQQQRDPLAAPGPSPEVEDHSLHLLQDTPDGAPQLAPPVPAEIQKIPILTHARSLGKPVVTGTIKVGNEPEGVAVSPDNKTVYVANQSSRILSVVDVASKRVASVELRNTPRFVAVSRDGRLVFVSMYETDKSGSGVAVVDARSRKVLRYLGTGVQPYTLLVGPDDRLWVPIHGRGTVEIFGKDATTLAGRVAVPNNPHAIGFSADLARAYTANHESNAVAVLDMRTGKVLKTIPVSKAPHSVAVSPDGQRVLSAGYEADTADLIDARDFHRIGPLRVGTDPQSVAFAADSSHAYVVNEGDDTVSVLDGFTGAVTSTVKVGGSPRVIAVSPDGRSAYVSNGDDNTISVLKVG
ncbi:YncE family protein [Symbioplanes lichenis]|uniref:YncE family protein n=1 Tax=Symbioplanes lichenis TaxID=1629072 RepID=UPI002739C572|nr:YncE family protein [Actinoplanes lichenis]